MTEPEPVWVAAGGVEGLTRLAAAWHRRVLADEVVGHAFRGDIAADHVERLAADWVEALGGPALDSERGGDETSVVRMHSGNGPHHRFAEALDDEGLAGTPVGSVLHDDLAWATTTTMAADEDSPDDVPDGLAIPRWSWGGLER